jgi:hypothetical protein
MSDVHNSLRLGDLLVEKGLITRPQLRQAIEIQQALQTQRFGGKNINGRTELGEILIELGFISRHQLQSNLNWQRRLRATTAVMVFIAPLLTAACGGGAGGSTSTNSSNNVKTEVVSPQAASTAPAPETNPASGNASSVNTGVSLPDVSEAPAPAISSVPKFSSSSQGKLSSSSQSKVSSSSYSPKAISSASSARVSSASSLKTSPVSSSKASSVSSSKASSISSKSSIASSLSSSKSIADGPVQLYWNVPTQRENGEYLDITEIGGYELRYKLKTDSEFKTIHISDGFLDAYYFNYLKGDYQFQIATFDKDGLYSDFIDIDPS